MDINALPDELLGMILDNLWLEDKLQVLMVCQRWRRVAQRSFRDLSDWVLNNVKKLHERCFNRRIEVWNVFHLFPNCKKLYITIEYGQNNATALDAIAAHFRLEHLSLNLAEPLVDYDWIEYGAKLPELVSLAFDNYSTTQYNYEMIPFCPNLTRIEFDDAVITDEWRKVMPKRISIAAFRSCQDDRSDTSEGLFSFMFEDVGALVQLTWKQIYAKSRDLMGLVNLNKLNIDTVWSESAAAFEHCKSLTDLQVQRLRVDDLTPERHILPMLEYLDIDVLDGKEEDVRLFCPKLVTLSVYQTYAESDGSNSDDNTTVGTCSLCGKPSSRY